MATSEHGAKSPQSEQAADNAVGAGDPGSLESLDHCESEDYKLCLESGYGVPIVWSCGPSEAGQQFRVDAPALARLVARAGAARPVALVSVAGAFRGGKSFLLDFMLRYLYSLAEVCTRARHVLALMRSGHDDAANWMLASSGAASVFTTGDEPSGDDWLGGEEEPLRGFSWRGGSARETTGIVLWSQPFPVTLPTGEKVAVLLMDTQGSFDEQSSLRDCSMIFALSTLLASTQVYNISQKIREDDLQHLQLFTEYAAAGGGGLAALRLLLRDWSAPYECAYGAAGGARYLRDKLQVKEEHPRESRDIRQRLAASFEDMSCFLMPHPGLCAANNPNFQGKLSELETDFKQSLRELVPLLLAPAHLRAKHVAGRPLAARELPVLLQAYLDEFNTRVPTPRSVLSVRTPQLAASPALPRVCDARLSLQATARAAWLCGREAARARVVEAAPARALPRGSLRARLSAAARDALLPLPPLADRADDLPGLAAFEKELDALVDQYAEINDRRLDLAIAAAKESFEGVVRELEQEGLCLHPLDLSATIADARKTAMTYFNCDEDDESAAADPDLAQLANDLEERSEAVLRRLSAVNTANNSAAVEAARAAASAALARALPRVCAGAAALAAAHDDARRHAAHAFHQHRNKPTTHQYDDFVTQLEQVVQCDLSAHTEQNATNNRNSMNEAFETYQTSFNFNNGFWRPDHLAAKHEEVKELAINYFYDRRDKSESRERDEFVCEMESELLCRYNRLRERNEAMNENAVDEVFNGFCSSMDVLCAGLRWQDLSLLSLLRNACVEGKYAFLAKRVNERRELDDEEDDLYLQLLLEKMEGKMEYYRHKNSRHLSGLEVTGVVVGSVVALGVAVAGGVGVVVATAAYGPAAAAAVAEAGASTTIPVVVGAAATLWNVIRRPLGL
ncbi:hypothetical protein MSG28_011238 [Choristoneura fumiferana]|uniref:Uncharacterized protein n=1 Tax=Choristoneura fumiferana TaxID=7141 RepID=A0ACC0KRH7_CHOFU|nr:hypothetical protein MSG28_011238 [Choristoneura fumiferana]